MSNCSLLAEHESRTSGAPLISLSSVSSAFKTAAAKEFVFFLLQGSAWVLWTHEGGRQRVCSEPTKEHLDRAVALAGCYCSSSESNVRSAARLQRGWGQDKIHRGPRKRSHWWEDCRGTKPGLFTSWQPCSRDVAALNSCWGHSYNMDVLIRGLSGVRAPVLYTVRCIVFMDSALWGVCPSHVTEPLAVVCVMVLWSQ